MAQKSATLDTLLARFFTHFTEFPPAELFYSPAMSSFFRKENGVLKLLDQRDDLMGPIFRFIRDLKIESDLNPDPIRQSFNPTPAVIRDFLSLLPNELPKRNIVSAYALQHIALNDDTFLDTKTFEIVSKDENPLAFLSLPLSSAQVKEALDSPQHIPSCPLFLNYLTSVLVFGKKAATQRTDLDLVAFTQEMLGYLLVPQLDAHAAFFLHGQGANGKSVLLEIIGAMFPKELTSRKTLEGLTKNRFATSALLGKLVNIAGEDDSKYLATDIFKQLVTGEPIEAEFKHGAQFTFEPHVKLIFSVNDLPSFESLGFAIRRRLHLVPFNRTISAQDRDTQLASKIVSTELNQVILWALQGAKRLHNNRYAFTASEQMTSLLGVMEVRQSSVVEFVTENYIINEQSETYLSTSELYKLYKWWCEDSGRKARPRIMFIEDLVSRFEPEVERARKRFTPTSNPVWCIKGLEPRRDEETWLQAYLRADNTTK